MLFLLLIPHLHKIIDDKNYTYGFVGGIAVNVYIPNKFMLTWKSATDDSFMRGYSSSKIGGRTKIQVQLGITLVIDICADDSIRPSNVDQNDFKYFTSTICYPNIKNVKLTPLTHYLCNGIVCKMFDDNPDPQVLTLEVIGEIGGSAIRSDISKEQLFKNLNLVQ
ncbi:MAG: hypothetical protein EZS28_043585 [Streblomastix strix]|uniref:Uncharacterized protein n=1 Tax=Streblomastix strix TaxID=222440 RepID=A0A5J4TRL7_9EUKA|nr:MAG: hypothetical protein EZS28_043585 [Streblomastix strix]